MRKIFAGFYPPTPDELKELWSTGIIILDANVLLNLYRYSPATRANLLKVFSNLQKSLWLPHQAGLEFHENRLKVIFDQRKAYEDILKDFQEILTALDASRGHPFIPNGVRTKLGQLQAELKKAIEPNQKELEQLECKDSILEVVTALFVDRVGPPLSKEEMTSLSVEGEERYTRRIPPGFEDRKKPDVRRLGDLILWKQILKRAETEKKPILFVTDDSKCDWWWEHQGKTVGPHPALKAEVQSLTHYPFHMYKPDRFLQYASEHLKTAVESGVIKEVREHEIEKKRAVRNELAPAERSLLSRQSNQHLRRRREPTSFESDPSENFCPAQVSRMLCAGHPSLMR